MRLAIFFSALCSLAFTAYALSEESTGCTIKDAQGYPSLRDTSQGRTSNVSWACIWNYQNWCDALHIRGVIWGANEKTLKKAGSKGGAVTGWQYISWVSRGKLGCGEGSVWIEPGDVEFHADFNLPIASASRMSKGIKKQILKPKGFDGDDFNCLELGEHEFADVNSFNEPSSPGPKSLDWSPDAPQ